MHVQKQTFKLRHIRFGTLLWVTSIQYFLVQIWVALAWSSGYGWLGHTISDLGNPVCGVYSGRYVCSPLAVWMNLSFVVLGITMISGALIFAKRLNVNYYAKFGFWCMAAAGFGTILVGVFPESTIDAVHSIGASLPFVFGNLGMILIGCCMDRLPKVLRLFTILSGVLGLLALVLFIFDIYLGLGIGGMERVVAYPQTIWMIVFGWVLGCKKASRQLVHRG